MLLNYIKIALRNILRNKLHSFINIIGLSIGMACAISLFLFIKDEYSYDRHHSKFDRIYAVNMMTKISDREDRWSVTPYPLGQALKMEYPFIEESTTIYEPGEIIFLDEKAESINEGDVYYADQGIFTVFDHEFVNGSDIEALTEAGSIVVNQSFARKYFGEHNPVGKIISRENGVDYIVKGVFRDLPQNSSLSYNALISIKSLPEQIGAAQHEIVTGSFLGGMFKTWILLDEKSGISNITKDYERFKKKYLVPAIPPPDELNIVFRPLRDIYMTSKPWPGSPVNVIQRVNILMALAVLIIVIACINYMNLATAQASRRIKEVGLRKVLGAYRKSLIIQFLGESIILALISMLLSLTFVELCLPFFNNLMDKKLELNLLSGGIVVPGVLIITIIMGIIAGSYPAFYMSSFQPAFLLRKQQKTQTGKGILRKILVIIQYAISVIIIMCAIFVMRQMEYIRNMDLGFNMKNLLMVQVHDNGKEGISSIASFKYNLLQNKSIISVTGSDSKGLYAKFTTCGIEDKQGEFSDRSIGMLSVDQDFVDCLEMKIIEGRSFDKSNEQDLRSAVLVNERFVKEMDWTGSPVGKAVRLKSISGQIECRIIGVLKDYQFVSMHQKEMPSIIRIGGEGDPIFTVYIRVSQENMNQTIEAIRQSWVENISSSLPSNFTFIEETILKQYKTEEMMVRLLLFSSFLSFFVSCLGLFGLSSYVAARKTREIGIRKTFGASVMQVVFKMTMDFMKLVLAACVIACPAVYCLINRWHEGFVYSRGMEPWVFILAICIVSAIAVMTISYHSIKAAMADPVKALRYE